MSPARWLQRRRCHRMVRTAQTLHDARYPACRPQPVVDLGQLTVRPRSSAGAAAAPTVSDAPAEHHHTDTP